LRTHNIEFGQGKWRERRGVRVEALLRLDLQSFENEKIMCEIYLLKFIINLIFVL